MINDTVADFLARMQNGIMRNKSEIIVLKTKMIQSILEILKKENMIEDFEVKDDHIVVLAYIHGNREAVVSKFKKLVSQGREYMLIL
jgi:ribosomal protein S8